MRCLVTGATGFVGSWLLGRLIADQHSVAILTRPTSNTWRIGSCLSHVHQIEGDLIGIENSSASIQKFAPEVVFHLAWTGGNSSKFLNDISQVYSNVPGTLELMRITAEAGATTFINFGSCVEYGEYRVPVRESDPVHPKNLYGSAKYSVEQLMQHMAPSLGIRFSSLRLFWAYGPADEPARLIPSLIMKLLKKEHLPMTKGEQLWDYLYIEDAVEAIMSVMNTSSAEGIFNLGSGRPQPLRLIGEKIAAFVANGSVPSFGDIPYRPDQVMHLEADITRLQQATGWNPRVSLDEGLKATVAWYKENQ